MSFSAQVRHTCLDFLIYQEFDTIPLSLKRPTPPHLNSCGVSWMIIRVASETHFPLSLINPFFKEISALGHRQATCKRSLPPPPFLSLRSILPIAMVKNEGVCVCVLFFTILRKDTCKKCDLYLKIGLTQLKSTPQASSPPLTGDMALPALPYSHPLCPHPYFKCILQLLKGCPINTFLNGQGLKICDCSHFLMYGS